LPQPPQFALSVAVSTQAPEQREYPELQLVLQALFEHVAVPLATPGHTTPQPPQFCASVFVSTQPLPHWM